MRLEFVPPSVPLSINEANRMHWAAKRRRLSAWAEVVSAVYRANKKNVDKSDRYAITVHLPFSNNRRRDPHNYTSTVVKTIVDALVRAGLVPDDTQEYILVNDPVLYIGSLAIVEIEPCD